jgi:cation transport protein ChaC
VSGWARRFWQGSTDHRGVPGAPGRVVTLVPAPGERCWGRAFRVGAEQLERVLAGLDHREKGGYARERLPVEGPEAGFSALTYRATPGNANWLGPADESSIAAQIHRSEGPSGPNVEYLLRLEQALAELGAADPHVSAVADALRALQR